MTAMLENTQAPLLAAQPNPESDVASRTIRKLDKRVLLLCLGVVFVAYVDRGNIGYAAKDLCNDLDLNHEEYGTGVSMFFAGYLLTQILSNAVLKRVGAPIWLAVIMSAWGCAAAGMGFMRNKTHFYILRFALGLAEGGTFPGVFYHLSLFYPDSYLSGAYSTVIAAVVLSMSISSPISAGLLSLDGLLGVDGWRLLFIVEGAVPFIYALILYAFLPKSPDRTSYLNEQEKTWIATEQSKQPAGSDASLWQEIEIAFRKKVWYILNTAILVGFGVDACMMFWVTLIIDDMLYGDDDDDDSETCGAKHGSKTTAVLLTAIPYVFACLACLAARWYLDSNRTRSRSKVAALSRLVAAVFLFSWIGTREISFVAGYVSLTIAIGSSFVSTGMAIGLIVSRCERSMRATVTGMVNTIARLGPVVLPQIIGPLLDKYGYGSTMILLGLLSLLSGSLYTSVVDPTARKESDLVGYQSFSTDLMADA